MIEQEKTRHWASGVPRRATKENVSVIGLPRERLGEAAGFLACCFRATSNLVAIFVDERV